ncbi:MAG: branched-chain amino acid ABC transporter permease [Saccharomonospora viridis]|jgi:branched-chain amino acid transport system permease protein|uniref:Branched-chain amino acid ABC-type transport system, permease component n=2 Tax=Saccharomonospora viridis TaxID=1852 RepID=C7MXM9_SACVD|nr:branched-chain amino acid ABC transporter permease [Saccharomonospora viridis]ACU97308.1 branched-chain amino acid ABC-type transport system, permease component [Saccharomonospora viridis DSM 43017]KHF43579.1 branched-chain amino acid ABC transporter permease [Saccharomonospora viridis]SFO76827.1 branched-chain amino acid transport system permease protein [Saccharomonospora viridis]
MQRFVDLTLNGISQGAIYAAFALALVLIWRSTRIVNFAQGAMAMLTTYFALALIESGQPYWVGFVVALIAGFVLGVVLERLLIRPVEGGPELNAVIVTLGLFVALQALAAILFGSSYESFPAPFSLTGFSVGGTTVAFTPFNAFVVLAVLAVMLALVALFRLTDLGLRMRASALHKEVSRLLGIRVGHMLTLGWALAAVVGSLAGLLIAGGSLIHPAYMEPVIVFGFVAAVLGGLDSPTGAVVGGLLVGLALSYVSGYLGSELVALAALAILVAVLLARPQGLFGRTTERKV